MRNVQIVQNKDYVVILSEYFSLVRIIRLSDKHLLDQGRKWMGDSIAYFENDLLVVLSRHFRFTITDPLMYSQPFSVEMSLKRMAPTHRLYEYACHEGNYSLPSMRRAARIEELGLLD